MQIDKKFALLWNAKLNFGTDLLTPAHLGHRSSEFTTGFAVKLYRVTNWIMDVDLQRNLYSDFQKLADPNRYN